jgi:hypothetical protein
MLSVLIVMSVVLSLLTTLCPEWLGARASKRDPGSQIEMVYPPGEEVTSRIRRIEGKSQALQRLCDGELTLVETAAMFHRLNSTPAEFPDQSWRDWPGADHGERLCRQVIQWAGTQWRDHYSPAYLQDRLDRLERELEQHIAAHGGVSLSCHIPEE